MARRRKRKRYRDFEIENPIDGIEINNLNHNMIVGRYGSTISIFDNDNVCVDFVSGPRKYKVVSIQRQVRRANCVRSLKINRYKKRTNGRE